MFIEMMNKINKFFNEPINEPLRKSPKMVKAKTEAQILEAEEDYEAPRINSLKNPRGSVRLVPRYYPEEDKFSAPGQSHVGRGPLWDSQTAKVKENYDKKPNHKKP